ncbi:MAG: triose-phosphate isomerase [Planctomycetota bacterium]|nr:MAG: triose-phosphate isomerase [Planctomycetota bacterium]
MRTPYLAGNWKMHLGRAEVDAFCAALAGMQRPDGVRVGIFPTDVWLERTSRALAGSEVVVGAQTCRPEHKGAFTGETSVTQVQDAGASAVIVGHSERRHVLGETDADVRARLDAALAAGLDVLLCVGETLEQREANQTDAVVLGQLTAGTEGLDGALLSERVSIAYEPVWAIGTGKVATPDQAQAVHASIRAHLAQGFGAPAAERSCIQYGGSVKPGNVSELLACPDIDGALVGGASLTFDSFAALIVAAGGSH